MSDLLLLADTMNAIRTERGRQMVMEVLARFRQEHYAHIDRTIADDLLRETSRRAAMHRMERNVA